jgi:ABC-type dipeptide/oligopeptide/nickel transport system permease component
MVRSLASRIGTALISIVGVSMLSFALLRVTPGDPVGLVLGPFATKSARQALAEQMGLGKPLWQQYLDYVGGVLRGDWGYSYSAGVSVREILLSRLPASLEIGIGALVFTVVAATLIAVVKVLSKKRLVRRALDLVTFIGLSLPQFWLALLLLVVFSEFLGVLPGPEGRLGPDFVPPPTVTGLYTVDALLAGDLRLFADAFRHLLLPSIALGLYSMSFLSRVLYANLAVSARQPFVRMSVMRGLTVRQATIRHALPNALVTSLTAAGVLVGTLLTGGVLIEGVFAWPGIGAAVTGGVQKQDYSVVQAFILFSAVAYVVTNLAVELAITRLDPRIRDAARRHRPDARTAPTTPIPLSPNRTP